MNKQQLYTCNEALNYAVENQMIITEVDYQNRFNDNERRALLRTGLSAAKKKREERKHSYFKSVLNPFVPSALILYPLKKTGVSAIFRW